MLNSRRKKGSDVNNRNQKTKRIMMQMTKLTTMMKVTMTTKVSAKKARKVKNRRRNNQNRKRNTLNQPIIRDRVMIITRAILEKNYKKSK